MLMAAVAVSCKMDISSISVSTTVIRYFWNSPIYSDSFKHKGRGQLCGMISAYNFAWLPCLTETCDKEQTEMDPAFELQAQFFVAQY